LATLSSANHFLKAVLRSINHLELVYIQGPIEIEDSSLGHWVAGGYLYCFVLVDLDLIVSTLMNLFESYNKYIKELCLNRIRILGSCCLIPLN
jgi:hypothetical protein